MRLILFDIDGTLLHCGPQVRPVFSSSLEEVYGIAGDLAGYDFRGKTDPQIVLDLQRGAGLPAERVRRHLPRFQRTYLERLDRCLARDGMQLLDGVLELLERLAGRADVTLGLLTGNWEGGARIKLERFDLNRFFGFGAFGDGIWDRRDLPPVALARAREVTGQETPPEEVLIVGDSLLDVACARAHGIPSLAVATGGTPAGELESAGADWVIPDLGEAHLCHPVFAAA